MRQVSRRSRLALVTLALLAGLALTAGGAAAATTNPANLGTSLAPSVPSDPVLHGVTAGGAPWVIKQSKFQLLPDGQVAVLIRGLVIPELGTPGPVTSVDAALYCGNETTPAATTQSVPLSAEGNALIVSRVTLPATCLAPAVLINPNSIGAIYIATSGFSAPLSASLDPVLLSTSLAPSVPSDPVLHGVTAGGAPWVIKQSAFLLLSNGQVVVAIRGLVIPELGTPGPVTSVDAALYCGNETKPAATTQSVPLSAEGNALIVSRVTLPATCLAPAVLINPNSIGAIYIATSGFGG
jgi:hypothetical protein